MGTLYDVIIYQPLLQEVRKITGSQPKSADKMTYPPIGTDHDGTQPNGGSLSNGDNHQLDSENGIQTTKDDDDAPLFAEKVKIVEKKIDICAILDEEIGDQLAFLIFVLCYYLFYSLFSSTFTLFFCRTFYFYLFYCILFLILFAYDGCFRRLGAVVAAIQPLYQRKTDS